jgi:hypothetical protein
MSETPQQYTNRILGYLAGQDPISVLKGTPATLDRVLDSVPPTVLNQHPAPGKWSVGEILAHLADAELVVGFRMRFILGAPGRRSQRLIRISGRPLGVVFCRAPRRTRMSSQIE